MCMNKASQQFIFVPFLQGFNSFSVSSAEPNSCLLSKMCTAYAEVGINIFKYFIIILIVSMNYIFVHLLDNKVF